MAMSPEAGRQSIASGGDPIADLKKSEHFSSSTSVIKLPFSDISGNRRWDKPVDRQA